MDPLMMQPMMGADVARIAAETASELDAILLLLLLGLVSQLLCILYTVLRELVMPRAAGISLASISRRLP